MPGKVVKENGYATYWGGKTVGKPKKRRSKKVAQAQLNLLRGKEHGWTPTGKPARYKMPKKGILRA